MPARKRNMRVGAQSATDSSARAKRIKQQDTTPPPPTAVADESEVTASPAESQQHCPAKTPKLQGKALVDPVAYLGPEQGDTNHAEISRRLENFALTTVTSNAAVWPRVIWQAIYQFTPPPRHGDFFALPLRREWAPLVDKKVLIRLHTLLDKTVLVNVVESYAQDTGNTPGKAGRARSGSGSKMDIKTGILKTRRGRGRKRSSASVSFADKVDEASDSIQVDTDGIRGTAGTFARRSKLALPKRRSGDIGTIPPDSIAGPSSNIRNGNSNSNGNSNNRNSHSRENSIDGDDAPLPRKTLFRTAPAPASAPTPYAVQPPLTQDLPPAPLLLTVKLGPAGNPNFIPHLHRLAEAWEDLGQWHSLMVEWGGNETWPGPLDEFVKKRLLYKTAVKLSV